MSEMPGDTPPTRDWEQTVDDTKQAGEDAVEDAVTPMGGDGGGGTMTDDTGGTLPGAGTNLPPD